ncbi:MAG TPA: hypothetical protein VHK01_06680, partial [Lacipirellulaceae bacterium]|nr:hypothetical protein [Lacipirellulaceae bacterium]
KKPGRRAIHLSAAERNRATGYTYAGIQEAVRWIERNAVRRHRLRIRHYCTTLTGSASQRHVPHSSMPRIVTAIVLPL